MYRIIGADGREYGPASADQLRLWINEGRVNAQTYVLTEGAREWKTIGSLPEFSLAGHSTASSPPTFAINHPARKTNSLAMTGMILGIVALTFGMCCCYGLPFNILGLIFSLIGYREIRKAPDIYNGQGIALTGIVLCILSLLLAIGLFALFGAISILDGTSGHGYRI